VQIYHPLSVNQHRVCLTTVIFYCLSLLMQGNTERATALMERFGAPKVK
jgi:hypothetical protein